METLPYFLLAGSVAAAAVLFPRRRPDPLLWGFAFLAFVVFIGLRHRIGMDWSNYVKMTEFIGYGAFADSFGRAEPGFTVVTWVSVYLGAGVYGVNLFGAMVFCAGLFRLCSKLQNPWFGLLIALPILVTAVSMSAVRQSMAIGILMWLLAEWKTSSLKTRVIFILCAAMFHYSAAFFLVFVSLELGVGRKAKVFLIVLSATAAVWLLQFSGGGDYYLRTYVTEQSDVMYSPGAAQHIMMNAIPASLLMFGRRIREQLFPTSLLRHLAILSIALIPVAFVASVAAGRVSMYLFPVSIVVMSGFPEIFSSKVARAVARLLLASVYLVILWVWLTYANSAIAYVPYRNAIFVDTSELHL